MAEVIGYVPMGRGLVRATAYVFKVMVVVPSVSEDGRRCEEEEEVEESPQNVWDVLNHPWVEYGVI